MKSNKTAVFVLYIFLIAWTASKSFPIVKLAVMLPFLLPLIAIVVLDFKDLMAMPKKTVLDYLLYVFNLLICIISGVVVCSPHVTALPTILSVFVMIVSLFAIYLVFIHPLLFKNKMFSTLDNMNGINFFVSYAFLFVMNSKF